MHVLPTTSLDDDKRSRCLDCGATIWLYGGPSGHDVALEMTPGSYVVEGSKAHESPGAVGYRNHWEYCRSRTQPRQVTDDEFLWN
jgi:hypothetical protein